MLDERTGQLRLGHYAIQEYLLSNSGSLFPQFELKLAFDCLDYMLLDDFKTGPLDTDEAIESRIASYPFISYSSAFWGSYVKPVEQNADVWSKLMMFYSSLSATAAATQVRYFMKGYREDYYSISECLSTTPLHHSALECLEESTRSLLEHLDVNKKTTMGTTPLIKAASRGHVTVTKLLLERGADPRIRNWYGNALQCAAEAGQCETVRQLVEWGMDPNGENDGSRYPVNCALDRDAAQALELLVDLGADLRMGEDEEHVNTFLAACSLGRDKIIDMMLRRGLVDVRTDQHIALALRLATVPILRRLISSGANVNAVDKLDHTALWYAKMKGEEKVIQVLQEAGAILS